PLTVATAAPTLGAWCVKHGAFDLPEDRDMPQILRTIRCRGTSTPVVEIEAEALQPGLGKPRTEAA
ncbi:MAG: hypothetical protein AAF556_13315, partial [Pseudomonadota bacterium]